VYLIRRLSTAGVPDHGGLVYFIRRLSTAGVPDHGGLVYLIRRLSIAGVPDLGGLVYLIRRLSTAGVPDQQSRSVTTSERTPMTIQRSAVVCKSAFVTREYSTTTVDVGGGGSIAPPLPIISGGRYFRASIYHVFDVLSHRLLS